MSILGKPARDLTPEDYQKIRKPLGSRVPYPGVGLGYVVGKDGKKKLSRYLGVLEEPLMVTSERDLDEVEGRMMRDMVTPEMLPLAYEIFSAMDPRNKRRAVLLIGAPGVGKTYGAETVGDIAHPKGAIKVDCTGMNLGELFFETVLDFNGNQRFYDALNSKLEKYNAAQNDEQRAQALNPMSVDILRDCLGSAFSEESGRICIDWGGVKTAHDGKEMRESIEIAISGLRKVSQKEGLDNLGGNALGMATQKGVAWQAYKEGRVLILDELNRAKRGTFGILHGWMQFNIGEISECRVRNPLKEKGDQTQTELVFRADEMAAGYFVFGTSNELEDSDEVLELPEALSSRMVPQHVPKAGEQGWQHRWCQILAGIPASTIYNAQRDVWDKDKRGFGKKLQEWRLLRETREVPAHQLRLLKRWEDLLEATARLSQFMSLAAKAIDPDSELHKKGSLAQLLDDISESFKKEVSVDFRKISYFINKATQSKPTVRPPQDKAAPEIIPLMTQLDVPDSPEDLKEKLGTHLTYVILDWIISTTYDRGKHDLGNQLMKLAASCALVDADLQEGMPSERRTIAQLLDENPFESPEPNERAILVRDLMCDYLRNLYPEIEVGNDELVPASVIMRAVETLAEEEPGLVVFNRDPDTLDHMPLASARHVDTVRALTGSDDEHMSLEAEELLSQYALLATLAAPDLRENNLPQLWNSSLSESGVVFKGTEGLEDQSLAMAEGRSDTGLAATTVMVQRDGAADGQQPLHLIWNMKADRLLVIGEGRLSKDLRRAFNDARISYVDRGAENAAKTMRSGLNFVLGAKEKDLGATLRDAFLLRNRLANAEDEKQDLGKILLRDDLECYLPQYIVSEMKPA